MEVNKGTVADSHAEEEVPRGSPYHAGILSALRHRDFSLYIAGATINSVGNWIQTGALTWYIMENTHSNAMVGAANLMSCLPFILVLFTGALVDHVNRKKLIIVSQVGLIISTLALAVSTSFRWPTIGVIFAVMFVIGFASTLNSPAWQAEGPRGRMWLRSLFVCIREAKAG